MSDPCDDYNCPQPNSQCYISPGAGSDPDEAVCVCNNNFEAHELDAGGSIYQERSDFFFSNTVWGSIWKVI